MLKIGIIGKSDVSHKLLENVQKKNNCNIVAISGMDRELAKEYGIENYFADYHDLISDSTIEAVLVISSLFDYDKVVLETLRCGKHVLSEKFFDACDVSDSESEIFVQHQNDFNRILDYINQNFRNNINTSTVAKALFMSRSYATVVFKKYSQKSINDYIGELRVNYANILLAQGKNITTVATASGFVCIRTFNNVYKRIMDITPTEYIKKVINKQI